MRQVKLRLENISKKFVVNGGNLHVLNSISLDVYTKEFLTIVGPSGCGKTTLIRIIAGLEKPTSGKIYLDNEEVNIPLKKIGYVPQEYSLFPWRTVKENIKFGLKIHRYAKNQVKARINELLDLVGLNDFKNYYPKEISGGMKQKVAIARALAVNQTLLLLDEPLISLDAQSRNKLQNDIIEIWKKSNRTMIFVTHNIDEAVYLSDRIVILSALPAKVKDIVPIRLKHPRNRTSLEFNSVRKSILKELLGKNL